jgi:hypothetical protein
VSALLRRHSTGVAAIGLVLVSVVLVLFAFDARAWQTTMHRDDIRFRALPGHAGLWKVSTLLPGDPAGTVLSTDDTIAWRHALQAFWNTRVGTSPEAQQDFPAVRAKAIGELLTLTHTGKTAEERSSAANLLGVLIVTTPVAGNNANVIEQALRQAISYFQQAIALDGANTDAKENLELVLRITRPGKGPIGKDARAGFGVGRGHGTSKLGNGY